jgi:hypothetical protein
MKEPSFAYDTLSRGETVKGLKTKKKNFYYISSSGYKKLLL